MSANMQRHLSKPLPHSKSLPSTKMRSNTQPKKELNKQAKLEMHVANLGFMAI